MYYEEIQSYIKFKSYWTEEDICLFKELELENKSNIGIYRNKWRIFNEYLKLKLSKKNQ